VPDPPGNGTESTDPGQDRSGVAQTRAVRALAHAPARGRPTGIRERLTKLRIRKDASPCEHARERGARKRGSARARERESAQTRAKGRAGVGGQSAPPPRRASQAAGPSPSRRYTRAAVSRLTARTASSSQ